MLSVTRERFYVFLVVYFITIVAIYFTLKGDLLFILVALIYPTTSLMALPIYGLFARDLGFSWDDKFSIFIVFLAISTFFFFAGDAIWCWYYNLLLGIEVPYPSIADIFYVLDYVFSIPAIYIYTYNIYKISGIRLTRNEKVIGIAIILLLTIPVGIILFQSIIEEIIEIASFEDLLVVLLDTFYVVGDIVLFILALYGFYFLRGKIGRVLGLVLISIILVIVYDLAFAILTMKGLYYDGHPVELFDIASNFFWAAAFYEAYKIVNK